MIWRKGNPRALLLGMQIGTATVENSTELFQKVRKELAYDSAVPLLGIYPKKTETLI